MDYWTKKAYQFNAKAFLNAHCEKELAVFALVIEQKHFDVVEETMDLEALVKKDLDELFPVLFEQCLLKHGLVNVQLVGAFALKYLRQRYFWMVPVEDEHEISFQNVFGLHLTVRWLALDRKKERRWNVLVTVPESTFF